MWRVEKTLKKILCCISSLPKLIIRPQGSYAGNRFASAEGFSFFFFFFDCMRAVERIRKKRRKCRCLFWESSVMGKCHMF